MLRFDFPHKIEDGRTDFYLILLQHLLKAPVLSFTFKPSVRLAPAGLAILACLTDACLEKGALLQWNNSPRFFIRQPFLAQIKNVSSEKFLPNPSAYNFEDENSILVGNQFLDLAFMEKVESKFKLTDDQLFDCRLVMNELMQNALTHSGAERYFAYAGLWEEEIHMGVLDMGVSIPGKLRQKYDQPSDENYISLAMEEGITTRRQRAGGLGLAHFRDVLKRNKGRLTIVSGSGQVRFYFALRQSIKNQLKRRLPGTWCFARFPLLK